MAWLPPATRWRTSWHRSCKGDAEARFAGADMSTKLKLMGVDVASIGDAHAMTGGARACVFIDERRQIYKKLVLNEDGTRLLGGILVGSAEEYGTWLQMVQNGLPLPTKPEQLLFSPIDAADGRQPLGLAALPDAAQICSCNNVSKGDLCAAIAGGARTFGALKQHTKAASSCGGCAPLVTQVLKAELGAPRRLRQQSYLRALRVLAQGALSFGSHRRIAHFRRDADQARDAASAAMSANPRSPRFSHHVGTSSCWHATRRLCKTRTTTFSPTFRKTALTRSCPGLPPAKSRRSSSSRSDSSHKSIDSIPRSRAASVSICWGHKFISFPSSGASWSTPGSSRAMPTASPSAR